VAGETRSCRISPCSLDSTARKLFTYLIGNHILTIGRMVSLATLLQTAVHPGIFFPRLSARWQDPQTYVANEKIDDYSSSESRVI
jgi:hypothetical protein